MERMILIVMIRYDFPKCLKCDRYSKCLFIILDVKVPIMTFANEVTSLILMKLSPDDGNVIRPPPFFTSVVKNLIPSLDRHNHPEHHELGFWSERVGPREGGQVHEAKPLGRDA